jgi:hypothetical protein
MALLSTYESNGKKHNYNSRFIRRILSGNKQPG